MTYKGKDVFVTTAGSEYVSLGGRDAEMTSASLILPTRSYMVVQIELFLAVQMILAHLI